MSGMVSAGATPGRTIGEVAAANEAHAMELRTGMGGGGLGTTPRGLAALVDRMDKLERRVEAAERVNSSISGLTARVTTLEETIGALRKDVQTALDAVRGAAAPPVLGPSVAAAPPLLPTEGAATIAQLVPATASDENGKTT